MSFIFRETHLQLHITEMRKKNPMCTYGFIANFEGKCLLGIPNNLKIFLCFVATL